MREDCVLVLNTQECMHVCNPSSHCDERNWWRSPNPFKAVSLTCLVTAKPARVTVIIGRLTRALSCARRRLWEEVNGSF